MELDAQQAARRLGVSDSRIRQLLRAGDLRGRRLGGSWLVDPDDVARLQRTERRPGRPLAPKRAWGLLDLLDEGRAPWLSDPARSQVRRYLAELGDPLPQDWAALLRRRSRVLEVVAHPAALDRLQRADGVLAGGPRVAVERGFDLVALASPIHEVYVLPERWPDLSTSLALREGAESNLRVRLPGDVWPFGDPRRGGVGDAALAADLLEAAEPRAVAAGAARLDQLLGRWRQRRAVR